MSKFSERIGAVQATSVLQLDSISEPLHSAWNFLHSIYGDVESGWWEPAEGALAVVLQAPRGRTLDL